MSQPLQTISISAPGFKGLNSQDSPINSDPSFAAIADNAVIDSLGRIGARKGFDLLTTDATPLGFSVGIEAVEQFTDSLGNELIFSVGNNKIFSGTTTLVDETPALYTITANNWKMANFRDEFYFVQSGHDPLYYSNVAGVVRLLDNHPNSSGTVPLANEVLVAYGRVWLADIDGDKSTLYWSDTLAGQKWSGGTSGSLDLGTVWPDGEDEITALAAHNNFLIIFGRRSIVIYSGATSPSTMALHDTVEGVGCIARDTVVPLGNDLLFLSSAGLKSFGRVIQEKSLPLSDVSRNVSDEMMERVRVETGRISGSYCQRNRFYVLAFPKQHLVYCFDVRNKLEDGSFRTTRWVSSPFNYFHAAEDCTLYVGGTSGVGVYSGYSDNGESYVMRYSSHPLNFGEAQRTKFLKKIRPIFIGGVGLSATIKWSYGFTQKFDTEVISLSQGTVAEYGISEYGIAEYAGGIATTEKAVNTTGQGVNVTVALEIIILNAPFSIQEMNIQALLGRII